MNFYIRENNSWVEKAIEVCPTIIETFDETLDNATVVLQANATKEPIKAMTKCKITFGNESKFFYVVLDDVELFSYDPERYKHTLTLVQNTRELSKHLVKNSVFTQPATFKESYFACAEKIVNTDTKELGVILGSGNDAYIETLSTREKVKNAFVEIDLNYCVLENTNFVFKRAKSIADINTDCGATASAYYQIGTIYLYYKDTNNIEQHRTLTASDFIGGELPIGKPLNCPVIKQLLEEGNKNFYIAFSYPVLTSKPIVAVGDCSTLSKYVLNTTAQAKIKFETYYYSVYDIIDLLIKRQKQKHSVYLYTYERDVLLALPTREQNQELYDLLKGTIAPNFTFTQSTLFDCLTEIFKLFDATFTLDENNVLGIEYLNENNNTQINKDFSALELSLKEDTYSNGLVAYYQDAKQVINYPTENSIAPIRSTDLGVPSQTAHQFITDYPIETMLEASVYIYKIKFADRTFIINDRDLLIDISKHLQEATIRANLPMVADITSNSCNFIDGSMIGSSTCVAFSQNSNSINLGETFTYQGNTTYIMNRALACSVLRWFGVYDYGTFKNAFGQLEFINQTAIPTWDFTKIGMRTKFISSTDGRIKVESLTNKYDGELLINQSNGSVDLSKMGLNMLGQSMKSGEPTLSATQEISNWADRVKKGQIYIDTLGNKWLANVCAYTIYDNDKIVGSIEFVKNYNALSSRIKVDREKRLSNISNSLTIKSEDNLVNYLYISDHDLEITQEAIFYGYLTEILFIYTIEGGSNDSMILPCFEFATIHPNWMDTTHEIYVPIRKYACGNVLYCELSFDSPISAGYKTTCTNESYYTSVVKYAEDDGFLDKVSVDFVNYHEERLYPTRTDSFPIIQFSHTIDEFDIKDLEIYKQPNETFALNYGICVLAHEEDKNRFFIGQQFINNNAFIQNEGKIKKAWLYFTRSFEEDFKYSVLDTEGHGNRTPITLITRSQNGYVEVNFSNLGGPIKNWSICDENGKIYFACNDGTNVIDHNKIRFYMTTKKKRI